MRCAKFVAEADQHDFHFGSHQEWIGDHSYPPSSSCFDQCSDCASYCNQPPGRSVLKQRRGASARAFPIELRRGDIPRGIVLR